MFQKLCSTYIFQVGITSNYQQSFSSGSQGNLKSRYANFDSVLSSLHSLLKGIIFLPILKGIVSLAQSDTLNSH